MTADRDIDLLGYGVAALDEMIELDGFPEPDVKLDVARHSTQCGGICINALAAAAKLGLRCHFAGGLGRDPLAEAVRAGAIEAGLSVTALEDRPAHRAAALAAAGPSHAFVLVDRRTGGRTILMDKSRVIDLDPEDLPESLIARARALYVDAWHLDAGAHAVRLARRHGVITIADFEEHDPGRVAVLAREIDHLILPCGYARLLTGEHDAESIVLALEPERRPCTAVTLGAAGCAFATGDDPGTVRRQPAVTPPALVDTTGCGDAFHGAYVVAILEGRTVAEAVRFAATAAALSARAVGALAGQLTRIEIDDLLASPSLQ